MRKKTSTDRLPETVFSSVSTSIHIGVKFLVVGIQPTPSTAPAHTPMECAPVPAAVFLGSHT